MADDKIPPNTQVRKRRLSTEKLLGSNQHPAEGIQAYIGEEEQSEVVTGGIATSTSEKNSSAHTNGIDRKKSPPKSDGVEGSHSLLPPTKIEDSKSGIEPNVKQPLTGNLQDEHQRPAGDVPESLVQHKASPSPVSGGDKPLDIFRPRVRNASVSRTYDDDDRPRHNPQSRSINVPGIQHVFHENRSGQQTDSNDESMTDSNLHNSGERIPRWNSNLTNANDEVRSRRNSQGSQADRPRGNFISRPIDDKGTRRESDAYEEHDIDTIADEENFPEPSDRISHEHAFATSDIPDERRIGTPRPRQDSRSSQQKTALRHDVDNARPRGNSTASTTALKHENMNILVQEGYYDADVEAQNSGETHNGEIRHGQSGSFPLQISGSANVKSIVINAAPMADKTNVPNSSMVIAKSMPASVNMNQASINMNLAKPNDPELPETCWQKFLRCYNTSPFCPSKTQALELFSILCDGVALGMFVLALVVPWVVSVAPCVNCPAEFSAGAFLIKENLQLSYGVFQVGSLNNADFFPVSDYFLALNTTASQVWATQFESYYFPPHASILWSDISTDAVCQASSPGLLTWAAPYGFCPFSLPSPVAGAQAFIILACILTGASTFSMIAARKGRTGFAQCSAVCSGLAFGFGLAGLLWFSLWDYNRQHVDVGKATVPLRAILRNGDIPEYAIIPISGNFAWGSGYICCIFGLIFELITALVSWIAGTEKCFWAPDGDVIYGPDSWIYGADVDLPDPVRRPSLAELTADRRTNGHPYERNIVMS